MECRNCLAEMEPSYMCGCCYPGYTDWDCPNCGQSTRVYDEGDVEWYE